MEGHRSTFLGQKHKNAICDRTPPTFTSNLVSMCAGGFRVTKFQKELDYLDSFKSYYYSSDFGFLSSEGWGRWVGGECLGWSAIVYMSSGMLKGKESSNRIKLSGLVQDLLNFGVSGSLQLWEWGLVDGGGGGWGKSPTHMHLHTQIHAWPCTCGNNDYFM